MAKMFEIKGKTATQNAFLAFAAYNRAKALVDEHNGKIDFVDGKNIKATFKSKAIAEAFTTAFESEYTKAHKAYAKAKGNSAPSTKEMTAEEALNLAIDFVKANDDRVDLKVLAHLGELAKCAQAERDAKKAKPSKKPTTSSTKKSTKKTAPKKPTASKGNAFDYSVIKGKTNSDKNKALHKVLVEMGIKDSRTPEYMSVWNARPWAK